MSSITIPLAGTTACTAATRLERALLRIAAALQAFAVHRMERRVARNAGVATSVDDTRRDVAAAAHVGLLPR